MVRPADARERILTTAAGLFDERGAGAVSTAEIARGSGCSAATVRRHFPTREDLVLARLERFAEARDTSTAAATAGLERVPSATLVALAREAADRVSEPGFRGCALRRHLCEAAGADDRPARFARAEVHRSRQRVDDLVARLGTEDPETLAARIRLVLEGLWASVDHPDRDRAATTAVGLVQDLLAAA